MVDMGCSAVPLGDLACSLGPAPLCGKQWFCGDGACLASDARIREHENQLVGHNHPSDVVGDIPNSGTKVTAA